MVVLRHPLIDLAWAVTPDGTREPRRWVGTTYGMFLVSGGAQRSVVKGSCRHPIALDGPLISCPEEIISLRTIAC
jgi:hypothetical protein